MRIYSNNRRYGIWRPWFAWRPVFASCGTLVWLERVDRCWFNGHLYDFAVYRLLERGHW